MVPCGNTVVHHMVCVAARAKVKHGHLWLYYHTLHYLHYLLLYVYGIGREGGRDSNPGQRRGLPARPLSRREHRPGGGGGE